MKKTKIVFALLLMKLAIYSQLNINWAKSAGANDQDVGSSVVVDNQGNVYSCGYFKGTVDFDSGLGVYNLTSNGAKDVFIQKLDPNGNFVWAKHFGTVNDDNCLAITIDSFGDVLIAGQFFGTADFDPGINTFTLSSSIGSTFISKFSTAGNFIFAKQIASPVSVANAIATDANGNIYTTGRYMNTGDFDPGPLSYTLNGGGVFVSKLSSSGSFIFAKKFESFQGAEGFSIKVDANGNIYTCGIFQSTIDIDPGPNTYSFASSSQNDAFVSKLDVGGNFVWAKQISSNIGVFAYALTLDNLTNVYLTGNFADTCDFNPGINTTTLTSLGHSDIFVEKFDQFGNFMWVKQAGGPALGSGDSGYSIANDASNNIYITGGYYGVSDFDPGPGNFTLNSNWDEAIFIQKLDQNGNFIYAVTMANGFYSAANVPYSIFVDINNFIYIAGYCQVVEDYDPGPGTYTLSGNGGSDVFVAKYCQPPFPLSPIIGPSLSCLPVNTFSIAPVNGASSYSWGLSSSATGVSNGNVINVTLSGLNTTLSLTALNSCGASSSQSLLVTYTNTIGLSANSPTICSGSSASVYVSGANSYTWSTGANTSSITLSPTISTTYTITGSAPGCSQSSATLMVSVVSNPTLVATANPTMICYGKSATLSAVGANTYSWSNGNTNPLVIVTPPSLTTYTIKGFVSGCVSTKTVQVLVIGAPLVTVNSSTLCIGTTTTLIAGGALNYTWSTGSSSNSIIVTPNSNINYTVTGFGNNGCTTSKVATVNVNPLPIINLQSDKQLLCLGETAILSASGANSYTWNLGQITSTINIAPAFTNVYIVTGKNIFGCLSTASITQVVDLCYSIEETKQITSQLNFWPNPTSGVLNFNLFDQNRIFIIEVINSNGFLILVSNLSQDWSTLDISGYSKGLYLIRIKENDKVIKQEKILKI